MCVVCSAGSVEPDQLPLAQQRRLSRFIEVMISLLEMRGTDHLKDVDVVADDSTGERALPAIDWAAQWFAARNPCGDNEAAGPGDS